MHIVLYKSQNSYIKTFRNREKNFILEEILNKKEVAANKPQWNK